eukprot:EG_transcript_19060
MFASDHTFTPPSTKIMDPKPMATTPSGPTKNSKLEEARKRREAMKAFGKKAREDLLQKEGSNEMSDSPVSAPTSRSSLNPKRQETRQGLLATIAIGRQQKAAIQGPDPDAFCSITTQNKPLRNMSLSSSVTGSGHSTNDRRLSFGVPSNTFLQHPAAVPSMSAQCSSAYGESGNGGYDTTWQNNSAVCQQQITTPAFSWQTTCNASQGPAPSAGGPEDRFSSLAAMEVVEGAAPQPIRYHTVTQCDAFRPLSVEQYHWQEYQAQGASLWRHTPAAQHQCAAAAAAMPHALGASASSSPRSRLALARRQRAELLASHKAPQME